MHNAETKAPPSQEPRDHRVQAARAIFSQIRGYDPKASNDAVMWHLESRNKKVKRGVKADLSSALMWVLVLLQDIFVSGVR